MIALGVNIDHIATLRNARSEGDPSLVALALEVEYAGADSLTMHLREDRRHIIDDDLTDIRKHLKLPVNLEMAATEEMLEKALQLSPRSVCIVPEKRAEITTEGGLDLKKNSAMIQKITGQLKKQGIETSLFIEPDEETVKMSRDAGAESVELHTGSYAHAFYNIENRARQLARLRKAAAAAVNAGLNLHAGHGLNYINTRYILDLPQLSEVNIGHAIIAEALRTGMRSAVRRMLEIIGRV